MIVERRHLFALRELSFFLSSLNTLRSTLNKQIKAIVRLTIKRMVAKGMALYVCSAHN